MPIPPVIAFDYLFAPNAQKARNYLFLTKTPFSICKQPFALPRPDLTGLGITYRRVPVLCIGKDVFPDNASFLAAMQELLKKEGKALRESHLDSVYEAWGYRSFWLALPCLPGEFMTPQLAKDRANLFPVFAREDFGKLQPSARSEFRAFLDGAEEGFLSNTTDAAPFVGGEKEAGMADVFAVWIIKWWVETIGLAEKTGHGKELFPKVWRWTRLESMPKQGDGEKGQKKIPIEEATKQLLSSAYSMPDIGIDAKDTLALKAGERVSIEASDAVPGTHPQYGKLVGLNKAKTVIELENGLRMHFPKVGYFVEKA